MAERRPLHQSFPFRSGLETGGAPFNPPLLPYELSLIQAIGCSEEEYRELVRHAMLRQRVRPRIQPHSRSSQSSSGCCCTASNWACLQGPACCWHQNILESGKLKVKTCRSDWPTGFNQVTNLTTYLVSLS